MKIFKLWILLLFLTISSFLSGGSQNLYVRHIKKIESTAAGEQLTVEFYVINNTLKHLELVSHLELPEYWEILPSNDIVFTLNPFQNIVRQLTFLIPHDIPPGSYIIDYRVWDRHNRSIMDEDKMKIIIDECYNKDCFSFSFSRDRDCDGNCDLFLVKNCQQDFLREKKTPFESQKTQNFQERIHPQVVYPKEEGDISLMVTSGVNLDVDPEETIFVSCLLVNGRERPLKDRLCLTTPKGWLLLSKKNIEIELAPGESSVYFFCVKVPKNVHAGHYSLDLQLENLEQKISLQIGDEKMFKLEARDLASCYPLDSPVNLDIACCNLGNSPLTVHLDIYGDPCCKVDYPQKSIVIAPQEERILKLFVHPDLGRDDNKQFIIIKAIDDCTGETLYQNTITLNFDPYHELLEEDPYLRVPSELTVFCLGDNSDLVGGFQLAGGGVIDAEKGHSIEYCFRIPSKTCNTVYQADQRLYFNFNSPEWDLVLGDDIYTLSPLTQRQRYGRGAGIDFERGKISTGMHYTQTNCCHADQDPKDTAAYVACQPTEKLFVSLNYIHRDFACQPDADIVSLSTEYQINDRIQLEVEGGNNFAPQKDHRGTRAFRFNLEGLVGESTWFGLERISASPAFYGYYNDVSLSSGVVDFPLFSRCLRINLSGTSLKQDFRNPYEEVTHASLFLDQKQYSSRATYEFGGGNSLACHGTWVRAKDAGYMNYYDFTQNWYGLTATGNWNNWNLLATASWGNGEDFKTNLAENNLQKYYISLSKQISSSLYTSVFYDIGNTNYYEGKSWNISAGASLGYRHSHSSYGELFAQHAKDTDGQYNLSQISGKWHHTFANHHALDLLTQYFYYKSHYPKDFLFLVSYSIPFGFPFAKRKDIGNVRGCVVDTYHGRPVANTLVTLGERQCRTDSEGNFAFRGVKAGAHEVRTEFLPNGYTAQEGKDRSIHIQGAVDNSITIGILPSCSISGNVRQYLPLESSNDGREEYAVPLEGVRVIIERNGGEEAYVVRTSQNGEFRFFDLRPGTWKVYVDKEQLPKLHFFEKDEIFFRLSPKEKKEVSFRVKSLQRKMQKITTV